MKERAQNYPDLPAMAVVLTASVMFGVIVFPMLGILIKQNAPAGFLREHPMWVSGAATLCWISYTAVRIGRSSNYWITTVPSERVFHIWQGIAVGVVILGAYLMGSGTSPATAWACAGMECVVVAFYLCYIGYGIGLRQKLPVSTYLGALLVLTSAAYAIWRAPK